VRNFVFICFLFYVGSALAGMVLLAMGDYPRKRAPLTRGEEIAMTLVHIAIANVLAWLLWL